MILFDTHAHLGDERFDEDREAVIKRMLDAGVRLALLVGDGAADPTSSFELARRFDFFYAAAGVHPHDAQAYDENCQARLREWMDLDKVVALGEIGLDYHYDLSPRPVQRDAFDAQLELAYQLGKPVILHIREAHGDATDMLCARWRAGRMPAGVMHCYTGSWESAKTYLSMGLYISFSGAVTFKNAPKLSEVAQNMPIDRLLVETDCPYMAPVPMRGRRNEPAFVAYTAEKIAQLRGMDPDELAMRAAENGMRLFGINATALLNP